MIKKILLVVVQFVLFYVVFLAGSLFDPFRMKWFISHPTPFSTRYFDPAGLLLTAALFVLILIAEALARRVRSAGVLTSIAFVLALLLGLLSKFGWATHDLF